MLSVPANRSFEWTNELQAWLHHLVPGGAHTYSRGSDRYPEFMAPVLTYGVILEAATATAEPEPTAQRTDRDPGHRSAGNAGAWPAVAPVKCVGGRAESTCRALWLPSEPQRIRHPQASVPHKPARHLRRSARNPSRAGSRAATSQCTQSRNSAPPGARLRHRCSRCESQC